MNDEILKGILGHDPLDDYFIAADRCDELGDTDLAVGLRRLGQDGWLPHRARDTTWTAEPSLHHSMTPYWSLQKKLGIGPRTPRFPTRFEAIVAYARELGEYMSGKVEDYGRE